MTDEAYEDVEGLFQAALWVVARAYKQNSLKHMLRDLTNPDWLGLQDGSKIGSFCNGLEFHITKDLLNVFA